MMNATQILVPLDSSDVAEAVLPYVEALARALGHEVRLFGVVDTGPDRPRLHSEAGTERAVAAERDALAEYLGRTAQALQERGVKAEAQAVSGVPVDEILAAGGAADVALLAMATHGRGGLARWYVGSVADQVMRATERPLLLLTPHEPEAPAPAQTLASIVVPLDGSALAEQALPLAEQIAAAAHASLALVRVEPYSASASLAEVYTASTAEWEAEIEEVIEQYLTAVRGRLRPGLSGETVVLRGPAAAMLTDFVRDRHADLVVMATRGRGGFKRFVLGSTADRLVRAGVPVLLVRPTAPTAADTAGERDAAPAGAARP